MAIARQLEVVKDEDEKVDIETNFSGLSMKWFRGALQLTGTILGRLVDLSIVAKHQLLFNLHLTSREACHPRGEESTGLG